MNFNTNFQVKDNDLKITDGNNERIVSFKFPIRQVLPFESCYVVLIEPAIGQILNENIYGVSLDGKVLWQITPIPYVYEDSPYTGMGQVGDTVKICNWDGTDLIINPATGEILEKGYSK